MVITEYYKTRSDGVRLYRTIDAVVDKYGNPVRDENGNLIPTGKMIIQQPTGIEYSEAIDVENASYTYVESLNEIQKEEKELETEPK
jgi:hypothetical protein